MPCYGDTICRLCRIGICQDEDAPDWARAGPVYYGGDRPLVGLHPDPEGLMGRWWSGTVPCDDEHLHRRCFAALEARADEVMRKTSRSTLCRGIRTLLTTWRCVCPSDSASFDDALPRRVNNMSFRSGIRHELSVATPPLGFERLDRFQEFMGQACDFDSFVAAGLKFPTEDEIAAVVDTMLTGRDWSLVVPNHDECVECMEHRSPAEMAIVESREGSVENAIYWLQTREIARLGLIPDPRPHTVVVVPTSEGTPVGDVIVVRTSVDTWRRADDLLVRPVDRERVVRWLFDERGVRADDFEWDFSWQTKPGETIDLIEQVLVAADAAHSVASSEPDESSDESDDGSDESDHIPMMHQLSPFDQGLVKALIQDESKQIRDQWQADEIELERLKRERHVAWVEACAARPRPEPPAPGGADEEMYKLRLGLV